MIARLLSRLNLVLGLAVSSLTLVTQVFADGEAAPAVPGGAANAAAAPTGPGGLATLVPFGAMFLIMYFLMIRPQQKRVKEQQNMLSQLKAGDEVLTASGILGTVKDITDRMVTLEVDRNVNLRLLKTQVTQVLKGGLPSEKQA